MTVSEADEQLNTLPDQVRDAVELLVLLAKKHGALSELGLVAEAVKQFPSAYEYLRGFNQSEIEASAGSDQAKMLLYGAGKIIQSVTTISIDDRSAIQEHAKAIKDLLYFAVKDSGKTLAEIGESVGMAQSTLSRLFTTPSTPRYETLKRVAEALNIRTFKVPKLSLKK